MGVPAFWTSDLDGGLGNGQHLQVAASSLSEGTHVLTATATDAMSATGMDSVTVEVAQSRPETLVEVGLQLSVFDDLRPANEPHALFMHVENAGPDVVGDLMIDLELQVTPIGIALGSGGEILDIQAPPGWICAPNGLTATCDAPPLEGLEEADIEFSVRIDEEAEVKGTATFTTAASDWLGGNDLAQVDYRVSIADRVFGDGFE